MGQVQGQETILRLDLDLESGRDILLVPTPILHLRNSIPISLGVGPHIPCPSFLSFFFLTFKSILIYESVNRGQSIRKHEMNNLRGKNNEVGSYYLLDDEHLKVYVY